MKPRITALLTLLSPAGLLFAAETAPQKPVTPACMSTADLQVTDPAKEGIGTAVIGGLRATLRF